jgi:hypothetical protein
MECLDAMDAMLFLEFHKAFSCTPKVRHLHPAGGSLNSQILLIAAGWGSGQDKTFTH